MFAIYEQHHEINTHLFDGLICIFHLDDTMLLASTSLPLLGGDGVSAKISILLRFSGTQYIIINYTLMHPKVIYAKARYKQTRKFRNFIITK
jgi:hypothetical protein